jgi:hypothetical protein
MTDMTLGDLVASLQRESRQWRLFAAQLLVKLEHWSHNGAEFATERVFLRQMLAFHSEEESNVSDR